MPRYRLVFCTSNAKEYLSPSIAYNLNVPPFFRNLRHAHKSTNVNFKILDSTNCFNESPNAIMTLSCKQLRDFEVRLQENLYKNIKLLTNYYPTTKEFDDVFKPSMFAKSNKSAFQHVVYYLFTALSPELTKEKITVWPLYDVKLETTFRNQVIAFITYLNNKYDYANIPTLNQSQLISPRGCKFLKFLLRLSILVVHEHLKKDEDLQEMLLAPIKPHKNAKITKMLMENLKATTTITEQQTADTCRQFYAQFQKASEEAAHILIEQEQVAQELCKLNKLLHAKKNDMPEVDFESLSVRLETLQQLEPNLEKYKQLCETGRDLLAHLSSGNAVLEFKKENLVVPSSAAHLLNLNNNVLNLHQLFNSLHFLLQNLTLELPTFTTSDLKDATKVVNELNEKYTILDHKLSNHIKELKEFGETHFNTLKMKSIS